MRNKWAKRGDGQVTVAVPVQPVAYSIDDAIEASRVGRSSLYNAIKAGELGIMKVGRRTLVEPDELRRWLQTKRVA
jgi:excisionase family DNA binding protein